MVGNPIVMKLTGNSQFEPATSRAVFRSHKDNGLDKRLKERVVLVLIGEVGLYAVPKISFQKSPKEAMSAVFNPICESEKRVATKPQQMGYQMRPGDSTP